MNETLLAKQAFEEAVSRLQQADKLMEACEKVQELMPYNRVIGDCGSVALTLIPLGKGTGKIRVVINSPKRSDLVAAAYSLPQIAGNLANVG
jgi:hypothetical protein